MAKSDDKIMCKNKPTVSWWKMQRRLSFLMIFDDV